MIANNQDRPQSSPRRLIPWLNLLLVVILICIGIWYLSDKVSLSDIFDALLLANPLPIVAGLGIMLLTVVIKAWRWQLMFAMPHQEPSFSAAFWALMLGQYVNLIVPFFRLGEVARIYALNRQTDIPMARSIGTLVVEKVLDLIMLVLTIAALLPFVILPEFVGKPGPLLWIVPMLALLILYFMAFQTSMITQTLQRVSEHFPARWISRPLQWIISGLEGLGALRSGRTSLLLVSTSALIAFLAIFLPYVLFPAFDLHLGLVEAALIHVVLTIVTTPPSTPGKIGVFDGVVAIMLYSFGIANDAVIISYSIVFHLVVILPQIILGSIAAAKTDWRWHNALEHSALS